MEYSVLIIDDDIWMQRILSKTLHGYGFTKTYLASNGYDGLDLVVEYQPSLIIMDILMPELSGLQTLKIIKHIRRYKHIPVLMVSAMSDTENLGQAVKGGTAGFISKPFTRATVYEKLISIFGKERLDMIGKGEPIDNDFLHEDLDDDIPAIQESIIPNQNEPFNLDLTPAFDSEITPAFESESEIIKPKPIAAQHENLNQIYQDDEKRSIESIKKLLLKSKR